MKLQSGYKIVMMGDSVTDADRAKPAGEGLFDPYGKGYVAFINALYGAHYPELRLRFINKGISGNTVRNLAQRWQEDVFDLAPDWVSVMIGINDVWRQLDSPLMTGGHVLPEEYAKTLEQLVADTLPRVKGMTLMTPYYIETNRDDAMRKRMDEYGAIVRSVAEKHKTVFIDTQAAFERYLQNYHSSMIAWDRVHPNNTGHMVLARAWCNAMGFGWQA